MLFCFGVSWPFAIAKTLRARRVDGKSPMFMFIVIIGYAFGIANRLLNGYSWVLWAYIVDTLLVATDLSLYFYFSNKQKGTNK